ncbi:MAG: helix-turn-helix domain-containing protein [Ruminococcaceae bacterium]|nr:helix-turn-helix domain-containing protein [Oscillospiraceae bacterium]
MKEKDENVKKEKRQLNYSKVDVIKLDTKCLYAGKLERIKEWHESAHSHPLCEIMFVFAGKGEAIVANKVYSIEKGDLIVYNPYTVHEERTTGKEGLELGFFGITNFQVSNLPADCLIAADAEPILHTKGDAHKFEFYFRSLIEEVSVDRQYNELMAKYWARLILIGILRLANISEAKFVTNAIFTRIHQYLSTHFTEIESMDQICEELNVSKYYLSHVFKNYMGVPPMQYITTKRISYAKKLLQETDLTATAIGEACGYRDHVLFFKAFKKVEGTTPQAFRKQAGGPRMTIQ